MKKENLIIHREGTYSYLHDSMVFEVLLGELKEEITINFPIIFGDNLVPNVFDINIKVETKQDGETLKNIIRNSLEFLKQDGFILLNNIILLSGMKNYVTHMEELTTGIHVIRGWDGEKVCSVNVQGTEQSIEVTSNDISQKQYTFNLFLKVIFAMQPKIKNLNPVYKSGEYIGPEGIFSIVSYKKEMGELKGIKSISTLIIKDETVDFHDLEEISLLIIHIIDFANIITFHKKIESSSISLDISDQKTVRFLKGISNKLHGVTSFKLMNTTNEEIQCTISPKEIMEFIDKVCYAPIDKIPLLLEKSRYLIEKNILLDRLSGKNVRNEMFPNHTKN